jgi:hypothetical protein
MVAYNLQVPLQIYILTRGLYQTHLRTLFSKPISPEAQTHTVLSQRKRIKIESFALKLAILNKNKDMMVFLIGGLAIGDIFIN